MKKGFWKGLKAIELLAIAFVLAVLSAVIYFRYDAFICRSMQSEAKFALQEVYAAEKLYHIQHDSYTALEKLHIEKSRVDLPEKYYTLSDKETPTRDTFKIKAVGINGLVKGEVWSIDNNNNLVLEEARCPMK
jgi:Tfp pilus assembly protein PilE